MSSDRRSFLKQLSYTSVALAAPRSFAFAAGKPPKKPNIVVILSDDVGYGDLSCYGATHVHTPQIDALARHGLRFTDAHSDASTCTPSRYAMLTGGYAWRKDGIKVLPGDAKSLIEPGDATVASVLKSAGYATGLVGKWHIGLGNGTIDWNGEIKPGPCEVGFDDAFFFAATADRVPTVYIHDHRVVNLDPKDPISVSYGKKIGDEPTGKDNPELLKMKLSEGHDGTIVDGISRIGYMTGGKSALWNDESMAATFTNRAVEFIEKHQAEPFLLYFTPSDIHVPHAPAAQFADKSACGLRCDTIDQLDWCVGRVLETLKRLHLDENTLVIFTSDNGPVVNDGYDDGSDRKLDGHTPAGPFRGGKYTIFEGGTRMPFVVRWPGHVKPGVSHALIGQVDLLASLAALVHQPVPSGQGRDSLNLLPALLGDSTTGRKFLVEEAQVLAIRDGNWKLIDRGQTPGAHPRPARKPRPGSDLDLALRSDRPYPIANLELYDLSMDPHETRNLATKYPEIVERMRKKLATLRERGASQPASSDDRGS
ncbi:MAG TPA: sulfatase-like hydrolase/transferase [Acidobacteriaceae bacterium]|nr:sulfatase-like hydrolase/transferase [Acidobacteriaceae bacterium]